MISAWRGFVFFSHINAFGRGFLKEAQEGQQKLR